MRRFLYLMPLLLLAASAAGCGSKAPADSTPPPDVIKNPVRPDPEAIQKRKLTLIAPEKGNIPSRINGEH